MKTILLTTFFAAFQVMCSAQNTILPAQIAQQPIPKTKTRQRIYLLKEAPATLSVVSTADTVPTPAVFKPTYQVGTIIHMFTSVSQGQTSALQETTPGFENKWRRSFNLYRARLLFGAQLSRKGSVFFETDIPNVIGNGPNNSKNIKVSPIILDAQYEHDFSSYFTVIAGQQLVSHNRNGLQGAATLMANDFTYYQYPYNMFESDPLQGNFGRDLGINTRGFFLKDKLEYRLGAFTGRKFNGEGPIRVVGRVVYNFLDPEKDFYYAGTKLGAGKTVALAGGFDVQGTYKNVGADAFIDVPAGRLGSVTVNTAFTHLTGGTKTGTYSFATLMPRQNIEYLELGYYFKETKLQPWFKYENQHINAEKIQVGLPESASAEALNDMNILKSNQRLGGGLNYFFSGFNTNLKASYTSVTYGRPDLTGQAEKAKFGEWWLQLQLFVF
ncbi:MAG: hypothetical protein M3Q05_09570 [Bacteroidota bacterium]|nr:hypothetical protein [Bacteroidota bacterium]